MVTHSPAAVLKINVWELQKLGGLVRIHCFSAPHIMSISPHVTRRAG
jgi:hypothetical protein